VLSSSASSLLLLKPILIVLCDELHLFHFFGLYTWADLLKGLQFLLIKFRCSKFFEFSITTESQCAQDKKFLNIFYIIWKILELLGTQRTIFSDPRHQGKKIESSIFSSGIFWKFLDILRWSVKLNLCCQKQAEKLYQRNLLTLQIFLKFCKFGTSLCRTRCG